MSCGLNTQPPSDSDAIRLHEASISGPSAVHAILEEHRAKLRRMIAFRMDRRIQRRVDPSDVIQDAYVEAIRRLPEYLQQPDVPFYVWLRFLTQQKLVQVQQHHLGVQARDARRERYLQDAPNSAASRAIVAQLIGHTESPSHAVVKAELRARLDDALRALDETDHEVLALRHFEQLSNGEVAKILELSPKAASKRYFRALAKLKKLLPRIV